MTIDIEEIRARLGNRTCDDWFGKGREQDEDGFIYHPQGSYLGSTMIVLGDTYENDHLDLDFIANAPADIRDLLDALNAANERNAKLEEAAEVLRRRRRGVHQRRWQKSESRSGT